MVTSATTSSGFDVNAIVTGLMSIERQPIDKLTARETSYQAKLTALGLIKSNVASFQTAVKGLDSSSSSSLLAFKATSSDATAFSASVGSTAATGAYALNVTKLAQAQSLVAVGQASSTTAIGSGSATIVTFDFGTTSGTTFTTNGSGTKSITIDGTNNTLAGMRDAINAAQMGVTATIVNDGSGTPYRLALTSTNSGASNSMKITTDAGDATVDGFLTQDPAGAKNLTQTVAAQDAAFTVDGIAITNSSNTITNAIQGVTLTLNKLTTTSATLTVARDTTAVSDKVTAFVKAYNDLYSALKNSAAYGSKSALEGESTLRSMQTQLRSITGTAVSGGTMSHLYQVGISFQANGTMQLDSTKLDSAMTADFDDVANLFNSATGYATQFGAWATTTLAIDGTLATKTNGIDQYIKNVGAQRDILETRMKVLQKQYTTTYSNLNMMLSSMGQTSAYITQQLG